jgi:hypothetical protein
LRNERRDVALMSSRACSESGKYFFASSFHDVDFVFASSRSRILVALLELDALADGLFVLRDAVLVLFGRAGRHLPLNLFVDLRLVQLGEDVFRDFRLVLERRRFPNFLYLFGSRVVLNYRAARSNFLLRFDNGAAYR